MINVGPLVGTLAAVLLVPALLAAAAGALAADVTLAATRCACRWARDGLWLDSRAAGVLVGLFVSLAARWLTA